MKKIVGFDEYITKKIQLLDKSGLLHYSAIFFAHSGDSWFWMVGMLILWVFSENWRPHAAFFAFAIFVQAVSVLLLKFAIKRSRPAGNWGGVYRNTDPHSFPSGHAVRAVMLAVLAWGIGELPMAVILTLWAPLVGLARIQLALHYFIDVLVGWFIGLLLGFCMMALQPLFPNLFPFLY